MIKIEDIYRIIIDVIVSSTVVHNIIQVYTICVV